MSKIKLDEAVEDQTRRIDENNEKIMYLWNRWQDEKEHEDINDYLTAIKAFMPETCKMTKKPFGFETVTEIDGKKLYGKITVKSKAIINIAITCKFYTLK